MGPMSKIGFILDPYPWWNASLAPIQSAGSDSSCGAIPQDCRMSLTCQHEVARAVGISPLCWLKKSSAGGIPYIFAGQMMSHHGYTTSNVPFSLWLLGVHVATACDTWLCYTDSTLERRQRPREESVVNTASCIQVFSVFFNFCSKMVKVTLWIQHSHQFHLPKEPGCQTHSWFMDSQSQSSVPSRTPSCSVLI